MSASSAHEFASTRRAAARRLGPSARPAPAINDRLRNSRREIDGRWIGMNDSYPPRRSGSSENRHPPERAAGRETRSFMARFLHRQGKAVNNLFDAANLRLRTTAPPLKLYAHSSVITLLGTCRAKRTNQAHPRGCGRFP